MIPSATPFDPVVSKNSLGELGSPIGENNGESEGVYPLSAHPGWLLKIFKSRLITDADMTRIDQLIALAATASPSDRILLSSHTSWPVARVTSTSNKTYGVVLPIAPRPYWVNLRLNASHTKYKPLEIDWLATAPEKCRRRSVPVPSFADRVQICADLVAVAELLERHNLVYGDWSYANAFWSADERSGYVIDLDGCAFGARTSFGTQNWDDPLATGKRTDTLSDRYGVALLLARCLTGERMIMCALDALQKITTEHDATNLYDQVRSGVVATKRDDRPPIATLLAAVRNVGISAQATAHDVDRPPSGVVDWVPVPRAKRPATAPKARLARPSALTFNRTPPIAPRPDTTPLDPFQGNDPTIAAARTAAQGQLQPTPLPVDPPVPDQEERLTDSAKITLIVGGVIIVLILLTIIFG